MHMCAFLFPSVTAFLFPCDIAFLFPGDIAFLFPGDIAFLFPGVISAHFGRRVRRLRLGRLRGDACAQACDHRDEAQVSAPTWPGASFSSHGNPPSPILSSGFTRAATGVVVAWHSTVRRSRTRHVVTRMARCGTARHGTDTTQDHHSMSWHITAGHGTARHGTAWHSCSTV